MMHTKAENQKYLGLIGAKTMWKRPLLRDFIASQQGTTAIEYALIASGISVVIIISGSILGDNITTMFNTIESAMN